MITAGDYRHFTPLHYAAKSGSENNTLLLLANGADPNAFGHRLKTPLHKARSPKVVKLLLHNGGNPYLKMIGKLEGEKCYNSTCECCNESPCEKGVHSVFSTLLHRNDKSAEALLNEFITTNEQAIDSSDLLIVYDLEMFKHEAEHINEEPDEMSAHSQIVGLKSTILSHPLSLVMLRLKWKSYLRLFRVTVVQYILFLLALSALAIHQTHLVNLYETSNPTIKETCLKNSSAGGCYFRQAIETTDTANKAAFHILYLVTFLNTVYLLIREVLQLYYNWYHYSRSKEDWMEAILIIFTIVYLVGFFTISFPSLRHLAAWSVFFAWMEMIMLIGRFSTIGIYVHMFFNVSKTLLFFVLVYSPALAAFAIAFYILLPDYDAFANPLTAALKTLVMLIGELEYEGNFMSPASDEPGPKPFVSTQLILVFFLLFISIVVMNLLVGLAVSEIDDVREKAKQISLEIMVEEIVRMEDLLVKKPTFTDCLPSCCKEIITRQHSLFSQLQNMADDHPVLYEHGTPWKLCVRPINPKVKPSSGQERTWYNTKKDSWKSPSTVYSKAYYPVYFYNEEKGRRGPDTGFELPKAMVLETLQRIESHLENKFEDEGEEAETAEGVNDHNGDNAVQSLRRMRDEVDKLLASRGGTNNHDED